MHLDVKGSTHRQISRPEKLTGSPKAIELTGEEAGLAPRGANPKDGLSAVPTPEGGSVHISAAFHICASHSTRVTANCTSKGQAQYFGWPGKQGHRVGTRAQEEKKGNPRWAQGWGRQRPGPLQQPASALEEAGHTCRAAIPFSWTTAAFTGPQLKPISRAEAQFCHQQPGCPPHASGLSFPVHIVGGLEHHRMTSKGFSDTQLLKPFSHLFSPHPQEKSRDAAAQGEGKNKFHGPCLV